MGGPRLIAKLVCTSNNYGFWYLQLKLLGLFNQLLSRGPYIVVYRVYSHLSYSIITTSNCVNQHDTIFFHIFFQYISSLLDTFNSHLLAHTTVVLRQNNRPSKPGPPKISLRSSPSSWAKTHHWWGQLMTGWWFQPLWKILVNWDYYSQYIQYMGKYKMFQTTNQMTIEPEKSFPKIRQKGGSLNEISATQTCFAGESASWFVDFPRHLHVQCRNVRPGLNTRVFSDSLHDII